MNLPPTGLPVERVLPELAAACPGAYAGEGLHDLGDRMFMAHVRSEQELQEYLQYLSE